MKAVIPVVPTNESNSLDISAYVASSSNPNYFNTLFHNVIPVSMPGGQWGLTQRPTFESNTRTVLSSGRGLGVFNWDGVIVQTYYNKQHSGNMTIQLGANARDCGSLLGSVGAKTSFTVFDDGTGTEALIVHFPGDDGISQEGGVFYSTNQSTITEITDTDMPGNNGTPTASGAVYLDGYLFIADKFGQIHNSNLNDYTTWNALDFISAESEGDMLTYLGKQGDHIAALGTSTVEFFYNAGNPSGSPLGRRRDLVYNVGCIGANYVTEHNGVIHFIGKSSTGEAGLYRLENMQLSKVESPVFDHIATLLGLYSTYSDVLYKDPADTAGLIHIVNSGDYYVATLTGDNIRGTFAVHLQTGVVSKWRPGGVPVYSDGWSGSDILPIIDSTFVGGGSSNENLVMFSNSISAKYTPAGIGDLDEDVITTSAAPDCFFFTLPVDFDTLSRKRVNRMRVLHIPAIDDSEDPSNFELDWFDTETLLTDGLGSTSFVSIDSTMFTGGRTVDLSTFDNRMHRCGTFRQRIFKGLITPGKKQLIRAIEVDLDVLND